MAELPDETLADRLAERRNARFVGRKAELELFDRAVSGADSFAVLYLHGPGGVGKTFLLAAFARMVAGSGQVTIQVDGHRVMPTIDGFLDAGRRFVPIDERGVVEVPKDGRLVWLIDGYDGLGDIDDWMRTAFLPGLPSSSLVVLAGRTPPGSDWRADPAWGEMLRVVSLRNLPVADCAAYLDRRGVEQSLLDSFVAASHGHPLALALLCDLYDEGSDIGPDPVNTDIVRVLLARFIESVPDRVHRRALESCAIARVTTTSLLRSIGDSDSAEELFEWLHGLSFIESVPEGLALHDLARDVLDRDLRWRDPGAYRDVFRAIRDHVREQLVQTRGVDQFRAIYDLKFLFRKMPGLLSPVDWEEWGRHYPFPAQPSDRPAVMALIEQLEGPTAAALAHRWWRDQRSGFHVIRDQDGIRGVICLLDLTVADEDLRRADPASRAAWDHATREAPVRSGEQVTLTRFVTDRVAGQGPSPTLNSVPIVTLQRYLNQPSLALDYLALLEPEPWEEYFRVADFARVAGADFRLDDRRFGLFVHDFRKVPVDDLVLLWTERALAQDPDLQPTGGGTRSIVLSHPDFRDAVRDALKSMHDPEQLGFNPLAGTRLVQERLGEQEQPGDVLHSVLVQAIESMRSRPGKGRQLRAVERTYVKGPVTQEVAAEVLGLPFSTYRRHLSQGVDMVVELLWHRELGT